MDTVAIIRTLWRLRLVVVGILIAAIAAAVLVAYKVPSMESRKYTVGVGSARILVDTPASQVVDVSPEGSDSLGGRAALLSSLMVDGEIKTAIAKKVGLKPDGLIGFNADASAPAGTAATPTRNSFALSTEVTAIGNGTWLPIIEIETQAPTSEQAGKLANAAVEGLREYLDSKAATQAIPNADRLRVSGLGAAQAHEQTRGPRLIFSVAALLALLFGGCAALIAIDGIVRALRAPEEVTREPDFALHADVPAMTASARLYELDQRREARHPARELPPEPARSTVPPPPAPPARDGSSWSS